MTLCDLKTLFGSAVRTKRAELGISQEELAGRSGLHRTYISDVERGARNLSLESIDKLARALDLSIWRLFERMGSGDRRAVQAEVLLVEDDPADIELTLRAFKHANLTNPIHVVQDGLAAMNFIFTRVLSGLERQVPLLVLLDLNLPRLSGMDVLRQMKADDKAQHIPVIVLTGSREEGVLAECRRLGVETCIVKPVDFRDFSEITPRLQFHWSLLKSAAS